MCLYMHLIDGVLRCVIEQAMHPNALLCLCVCVRVCVAANKSINVCIAAHMVPALRSPW